MRLSFIIHCRSKKTPDGRAVPHGRCLAREDGQFLRLCRRPGLEPPPCLFPTFGRIRRLRSSRLKMWPVTRSPRLPARRITRLNALSRRPQRAFSRSPLDSTHITFADPRQPGKKKLQTLHPVPPARQRGSPAHHQCPMKTRRGGGAGHPTPVELQTQAPSIHTAVAHQERPFICSIDVSQLPSEPPSMHNTAAVAATTGHRCNLAGGLLTNGR